MILQTRDIGFRDRQRRQVLDGITFEVVPGDCLAVCGGEHTGKSLLLKILGGLEAPTEGSILLDHTDIYRAPEDIVHELRARIGFLFSGQGMISNLNIEENLMLPVRNYRPVSEYSDYCRRIREMVEELGLGNILSLRPAGLSVARGKLAALIRMLLLEPEMLLLDNPLFNLDVFSQHKMIEFLQRFPREGKLLVFTTDSLELVREFADRVLLLHPDLTFEIIPREAFDRLPALFTSGNWETHA